MEMEIEGLADLAKALTKMQDKGSQNIARSVIRGGLQIVAKQMKADLAPEAKAAKKSIKSRFKRSAKKGVTAKVGVGVGKRSKKATKPKKRSKKKPGVGIGPNNIHWWVAGTKERFAGKRRGGGTRKGTTVQRRGRMPAMQPGLARIAYSKSRGKIKAEMIKRGALALQKEVAVIIQGMK